MEISEVRIKLISNPTDRLKGFASVTLDGDFVVRDIKIIDGASGVFVAMPSRKLADRCPNCSSKNHVRAKYCNECGTELPKDRIPRDRRGRNKLHADIAHPINTQCRQQLQQRIVEAYTQELENAKKPGYEPLSEEEYEDTGDELVEEVDDTTQVDTAPADGGDYHSLIQDLKRDAAARHRTRSQPPPAEAESKPEEEPKHEEQEQVPIPSPDTDAAVNTTPDTQPSGPPGEEATPPDDFGAGIV